MAWLRDFLATLAMSLKQGFWLSVFFVPFFYYLDPKLNVFAMVGICFGCPVFLGLFAASLASLTGEKMDKYENARRFGSVVVGFAGIVLFQEVNRQASALPYRFTILGSTLMGLFALSIGTTVGIDNAKSGREIGRSQVLAWAGSALFFSFFGFHRYGASGAFFGLGVLSGGIGGTLLGASLSTWLQELSEVLTYLRRMKSLLGAFIVGYAAIVFVFAGMYAAVWQHDHRSLSLGENARFGDFFYFSLVTAATLGYGDIVPISGAARALACVQVVIAIGWTTIVLAVVASLVQNRGILNGVHRDDRGS